MSKKSFSYYIQVFGCQMNYVDAEIITATLSDKGGEPAQELTKANLIVVVTCGVRASAEERTISWIKRAKNQNKVALFIVTGCLSHRKDVKARLNGIVEKFISIENWMAKIDKILGLICHFQSATLSSSGQARGSRCLDSKILDPRRSLPHALTRGGDDNTHFYNSIPQRDSSFQAYIPITTGCNNFCSYCAVPYARGREKSQAPEKIIKEAKALVKAGYKELYLLGQNVNSYQGIDKKGEQWKFAQLLRAINKIPGKFWIRFISSHPKDITGEFIAAFKDCRKVSPNLHLPVQSGSSRILKIMNRKYTQKEYWEVIEKIRSAAPETVFSTDIIVGFPGETEKDFWDSLDVVKKVGFEMLFSLKYSPRPETAAFKRKDNVAPAVKIARQRELDQVWKKISLKKNQRFIGKKIVILANRIKVVAKKSGKRETCLLGKSFENKDVQVKINSSAENNLIGQWVTVRIKEAGALALKGELVDVKC